MANSNSLEVTIRNRRNPLWPQVVIGLTFATVLVAVAGLMLNWLPKDLGFLMLVGSGSLVVVMMMFITLAASMGIAQRWIPYPVKRVKLGAFLDTSPGGMRYRPPNILQIAFGPDPLEDYAEAPGPERLRQVSITMRDPVSFGLIVSDTDADRLREWAIEKRIPVNDPEGMGLAVANRETVDRTIRNHRYHFWPPAVVFAIVGVICLTVAVALLSWLPQEVAPVVLVGAIILYALLASLTVRRLPHPVSRVKLGAFLQTFPGGLAHPPSMISDITFGPDPAEDYVETPLPVRMCQARISMRNGWRFQLIVSNGDAARLREWATEMGVAVEDAHGHSAREVRKKAS
jgi:uncharacterized membrane protein YfcA